MLVLLYAIHLSENGSFASKNSTRKLSNGNNCILFCCWSSMLILGKDDYIFWSNANKFVYRNHCCTVSSHLPKQTRKRLPAHVSTHFQMLDFYSIFGLILTCTILHLKKFLLPFPITKFTEKKQSFHDLCQLVNQINDSSKQCWKQEIDKNLVVGIMQRNICMHCTV